MLIRNPVLLRTPCAPVTPEQEEALGDALLTAFSVNLKTAPLLRSVTAPEAGFPLRAFVMKNAAGDMRVFFNPRVLEVRGEIKRFPVGASYTHGVGYWMRGYPEVVLGYQYGSDTFVGDDASMVQHDLALLAGLPVIDLGPQMQRVTTETDDPQRVSAAYLADINLVYPKRPRNAPCWCMSENKWKRCHGLGL